MILSIRSPGKVLRHARRLAVRSLKDRRGVAAVEFAFIAPIMLVAFFGTVEFTAAISIKRNVTNMARTMSDLTSQAAVVTDSDFANFFAASTGIMMPYSATPISMTVSLLYADPVSNQVHVEWSKGYNTAPLAAGQITVPAGLISRDANNNILPFQYLIYSHVSYAYTNPTLVVLKSTITLSDDAYTRPRQTTCVFYPSVPSSNACPTS
ncbi:MAG: pilus assembly protein [Bradyrhizobium sp.]|uniref:TadE/TadG family type IV pilus assembly protein n=1 Tax=Bradyrhizobium sp. TaxID=376 RepID=UPI001C29DF87|nr:TadE/TadG family type IV pilus assembly protein [Bradyrhizobium sp.]MBU6463052.1 pilus assembly protein [Pseudomonadota bacterium]MDE2069252.1 pilus assembly protein [Bradyrhizobium sp.]MDE2242245.1 pilus assembly protein [Bradyrhizobium sp.]MDE2468544.1 pilus assembly protein [Bradyrhizobium sp.]